MEKSKGGTRMIGPALKQLEGHRSIHQAAYLEAEELLTILRQCHEKGLHDHARQIVDVLVEHWETRTLRHAQMEEEGFYLEKVTENPNLAEKVIRLQRDHELMRMIIEDIKELVADDGVTEGILSRFEALLVIVQIHSREEERHLLGM
jgi:hypothetical protein